jgi:ABC-type phosphate transport system substrate-binding protein
MISDNTRNSFRFAAMAMVFCASALAAAHADTGTVKLIANNSVRVNTLPKKAVADVFLKKTSSWEGGGSIVPVDNAAAAVRDEFSRMVLGKATAAVKSYWNQQIFSGRNVPPVEKSSDEEVLAFVRGTPGAVGYVAAGTQADGVHVISVE